MIEPRRASGVFTEIEARSMHEAYGVAVAALQLTHPVTDVTKTLLADCVVRVLMTEHVSDKHLRLDIARLAARSIERLLSLHNAEVSGNQVTLH